METQYAYYSDKYSSSGNSFQETMQQYWEKAISQDTLPRGSQIIERLIFAMPAFMIGGALGGALAGQITQLSGMVVAGINLGGMFVLINAITNMACKVLGIQIASQSNELALKTIVDIALAALTTFTLCYFSPNPITLRSVAVLIPSVAFGALMTFIGSHLFEEYITNIHQVNQGLERTIDALLGQRF